VYSLILINGSILVKGSRSLDAASHTGSSSSESSSKTSSGKHYSGPYGKEPNHSHAHSHAHNHAQSHSHGRSRSNSHSRSNSTTTNNSSLHKKSSSHPASPSASTPLAAERDYTSRHATTNLTGTPIFIDKGKGHHGFLRSLQGVPEPGRSRHWPYLGYMINGFKNLFLTFYFNWPMIFTAPISSAAFIIVYPTTVVFLVLFELGLKLFMETWGGAEVLRYISLKYGYGFGAINWGKLSMILYAICLLICIVLHRIT
jgi:hypothetical protein